MSKNKQMQMQMQTQIPSEQKRSPGTPATGMTNKGE